MSGDYILFVYYFLQTHCKFQTYVVTQEKHAMEIVLDSSVIAFTCGQFTVDGRTMPALVYVHRDRVVVYYKLELKVRLKLFGWHDCDISQSQLSL